MLSDAQQSYTRYRLSAVRELDTRLIASDNAPSISLGAEAYHRSPMVRKQVAHPGDDRLCEWIRLVTSDGRRRSRTAQSGDGLQGVLGGF